MNKDEKCRYIDAVLDFHFGGGFTNVIKENGFGEQEVDDWASIAYLYACCVKQGYVHEGREDEAFMLLEDLYTGLSVDVSMGLGFDAMDLEEVGVGYDIELSDYADMLEYAFALLKKNGLAIWQLIEKERR